MQIKNKYLKYNIKNILILKSKYAIRLYEILKNELEINKRYNKKFEFEISLEYLKEMLKIPFSYKYKDIRIHILEKSQEELKKTDIEFEFESIKTGRKVTHIKFLIIDKSKKEKEKVVNNISQTEKKYTKNKNNFYTFKKEILEKAKDKIIVVDNSFYILKDGLLATLEDEKLLSKEEAWEVWNKIYKEKEKVKIIDEYELKKIKEEQQNRLREWELEELKKEWIGIPVEDIILKDNNFYDGTIVNIKDFKSLDDFSVIVNVDEKYYKIQNVNLNWLKNHKSHKINKMVQGLIKRF